MIQKIADHIENHWALLEGTYEQVENELHGHILAHISDILVLKVTKLIQLFGV